MDPTNSQSINNQQQTIPQPQNPVEPVAQQGMGMQYQNPGMKGANKTVILLVALLIVVVGLAAYLLFTNTINNNSQNTAPTVTPLPSPIPTVTPTPQPTEEDLTIEDPEADIKALDQAASSL
ncbi:MAG: hypothetical protein AAB583_00650 [Patescibacteria group bacterium]